MTSVQIKFLACFLMLLDHVGLIFFPQHLWLRLGGRLSLPIFVWFFVKGYCLTRSWPHYFLRLLFFGLIAQFPFSYISGSLNILLGFSFNLLLFKLADSAKVRFLKPLTLIAGAGLASFLDLEYGWYLTAIILIFLQIQRDPKRIDGYGMWVGINLISAFSFGLLQPVAMFSILLLANAKDQPRPSGFVRIAFYCFYPAHLAFLVFVSSLNHVHL